MLGDVNRRHRRALACCAVFSAGCVQIAGIDDFKLSSGAGGGGGVSASVSVSGGGTGGGGAGGCFEALVPGGDGLGLYDPVTHDVVLLLADDCQEVSFSLANDPGDYPASARPFTLDRDGDLRDEVHIYDVATALFYLREENATNTNVDAAFNVGTVGVEHYPLGGDWATPTDPLMPNGRTTIGVHYADSSLYFLKVDNTAGAADFQFGFGVPGGVPIAGDWNDDGVDTIGLVDGGSVFLRDANSSGSASSEFTFAEVPTNSWPVAGRFFGNAMDTVGLYDRSANVFHLRRTNDTSSEVVTVSFGPAGSGRLPIAGRF